MLMQDYAGKFMSDLLKSWLDKKFPGQNRHVQRWEILVFKYSLWLNKNSNEIMYGSEVFTNIHVLVRNIRSPSLWPGYFWIFFLLRIVWIALRCTLGWSLKCTINPKMRCGRKGPVIIDFFHSRSFSRGINQSQDR